MRTTAGTRHDFTLRIPLSITIVDAFSFLCGGETFVVPVAMVEEIQELDLAHDRPRPRSPQDAARRRRPAPGGRARRT